MFTGSGILGLGRSRSSWTPVVVGASCARSRDHFRDNLWHCAVRGPSLGSPTDSTTASSRGFRPQSCGARRVSRTQYATAGRGRVRTDPCYRQLADASDPFDASWIEPCRVSTCLKNWCWWISLGIPMDSVGIIDSSSIVVWATAGSGQHWILMCMSGIPQLAGWFPFLEMCLFQRRW